MVNATFKLADMSFTMLLAFVIGIFANRVSCYIFCQERSYLRILVFENEQATSKLLIIHLLAFYSDNDTEENSPSRVPY